jgi:hypothetical protein
MIKCNKLAMKTKAAKQKLIKAEFRIKLMKNSPANDDKTKIRLGVFEKYYMQHIEEIS